jgi:phosphoglucomutase
MFDWLLDMYAEYGFYKEHLMNLTKKGQQGEQEIKAMMNKFRNNPPVEMAGSRVEQLLDYQSLEEKNMLTGEKVKLDFPVSNVLQFYLADGSKVSVRPSGTEPKIKFYIAVKTDLPSSAEFPEKNRQLEKRIKSIEEYLMTV